MDDYFLLKAIYENRVKILELNPMFCNDVKFGNDFELMFYTYSDGTSVGGIMLGFQDYRIDQEVHLQHYYTKGSKKFISESESINPESILIMPESFTHTFINEPVKHFVPFKIYTEYHPRKLIATKTENNFWGDDFWSNFRTMIPIEYTETKAYTSERVDREQLKKDLDEEIPKFINSINAKIHLNSLFLNSSGWKK